MYDVIVIGGGHAGVEAAYAAAKNSNVALITTNLKMIASMPCNPSIGGPAKGIVVREVDALGGLMGEAADATSLQTKVLNLRKGPAVWSLRAQADKEKYPQYIQEKLKATAQIKLIEGLVVDLIIENNIIEGIKLEDGQVIQAKTVIITAGTYMDSLIIRGKEKIKQGPDKEQTTNKLSSKLKQLGFNLARFKTGTPPRLAKESINFSQTQIEPGDNPKPSFSHFEMPKSKHNINCYLCHTNLKTHEIILTNLDDAPMFSGVIDGVGPRYCPSIEDKVNRFSDKERHQIFLEPETLNGNSIYVQGLSTSFSKELQEKIIKSIPGLENAKILKYGYAIEYDVIDTKQLKSTLESKIIKNLYFAGQVNGTSGYEEAAGQGILAGINAGLKASGKKEIILERTSSYIGLLIDDLVTKGTNEPYRLLTSRNEYRLLVRNDNADTRLAKIAYENQLITENQYEHIQKINHEVQKIIEQLIMIPIDNSKVVNNILSKNELLPLNQGLKAIQLLKRPFVTLKVIEEIIQKDLTLSNVVRQKVEVEVKYEGYIKKELQRLKRIQELEKTFIPENFDFNKVHNLANEAIEKLVQIKPTTIAQASRISGITPSDIAVLTIYLKAYGK